MDVIGILRTAIADLPQGEYSTGLNAIIRHLETAVRHFERNPLDDPDSYTDSIYRTNQAYEGSLKEAYRVLADKDPARMTPNEIEKYLEENKVVRQRVLDQLQRYRQDYRNPSTHDYKLDFDESESLLAIVSVAAFAKLLVSQISEKLAFNTASGEPPVAAIELTGDDDQVVRAISEYIKAYCNKDDFSGKADYEFEGSLAGALTTVGIDADTISGTQYAWDILLRTGGKVIAVETRRGDNRHGTHRLLPVHYVSDGIRDEGLSGGIIVTRLKQRGNYAVYSVNRDDSPKIFLVTKWTQDSLRERLGKSWEVEAL